MAKKTSSGLSRGTSSNQKDKGEVISNATGPRTTAGKSRVRYNALRHGVFSSKLVVPDQDKEIFNQLQDELRKQLKPETALLQLAFQRVVTAAWRFRQAVEMEARRIQVQPDSGKQETEATGEVVNVPQWYAGGRQELNAAKRLLEVVREKVRTSGGLHLNEL